MAILDTVNIDFQMISSGDPKTLIVMDTSVWGFIEEKPSIIEIVVPGSQTPKIYNFVKNKTNIFNSSNLLLSDVGVYNDLNDGIYKVTVKGSPDTIKKERYFLKTDIADLELDKLYLDLGFDNTEEIKALKKKIQDIELLINAAKALVKRGNLKKSHMFFKRAVEDINDYNECKTCK